MSSARWCFTVNNPGEYRPHFDGAAMHYLVFQLERGENGTPHIQGYVRLRRARNMAAVKNILVCQEAHLEIAQGTEQQNADYCKKPERIGGPWEFGTFKPEAGHKGHRSDLQAVADLCKAGATSREIAEASPSAFIKYTNGIAALRETLRPAVPRERDIFVHILWGETNTGKTHRVRMGVDPKDLFIVSPGRDPWGKYEGQKIVCFEEFDYSKWAIDEVKELWDKWPKNLDARYHDKEARYTVVLVCANTDPLNWFPLSPQADRQAWLRRIHRITEVKSQEQAVELFPVTPTPAPAPSPAAPAAATPSTPAQDSAGAGASIAPVATLARAPSVNLQAFIDLTSLQDD